MHAPLFGTPNAPLSPVEFPGRLGGWALSAFESVGIGSDRKGWERKPGYDSIDQKRWGIDRSTPTQPWIPIRDTPTPTGGPWIENVGVKGCDLDPTRRRRCPRTMPQNTPRDPKRNLNDA